MDAMTEQDVRTVVELAGLAPSVHNSQPWRFAADAGPRLSLYAGTGRRLAAADPDGREMMISCGAALFSVRLALRSLGYIPETTVLPDPGQPTLVAQVSWRERAAADEFERRLSGQLLPGGPTAARSTRNRCPPTRSRRYARARRGKGRRCAWWRTTGTGPPSPPSSRPPSTSYAATAKASANWPGGRPHRAAPAVTGCRSPPTRRGPSTPNPISRAGLRPRAWLGRAAARPGHLAPGRRRGRPAHHG